MLQRLCMSFITVDTQDILVYIHYTLTHYQTTDFRLFQTERVCRRQFQIWQKWKKVIQTGRKHCWKRRNCSLRAISPFPTVFSKGLFPRGVKGVIVWEWVKQQLAFNSITSITLPNDKIFAFIKLEAFADDN